MTHSARNLWPHFARWAALLVAFLGLAAASPAAAQERREELFGWAGEKAAAEALRGLGDAIETYEASDEDYRRVVDDQKVCLWLYTKAVLKGQHLPTRKQQVGDCVSWGFGHAVEYSLAAYLTINGDGGRFVEVCKPYLYGTGRVFVGGGRLGGDGSTGAWQSRALEEHGVLAVDADGVPEYSGALARKWGAPPGPPKPFVEIARKYRAECKLVTTWEAAAVSIRKGAPVAVCSGYGFAIREARGRIEGYRSGSWPHCMCFIAVDATPDREALYCLNSWGENAHAPAARYAQLDGAPPGGFWVLRADVEGMLRSRDSYSVSFSGFLDRSERSERLYGRLDVGPEGEGNAIHWRALSVGVRGGLDLGGDELRPVAFPSPLDRTDRPDGLRLWPEPRGLRRLRLSDGAVLLAG